MRRNEQKAQRMKEKRSAEDRAYELDDDIMINGVVPFIDVSLEGVKKARSLLTRTATITVDDNQRHRAIGCVVCDEFIIGTEEKCSISRDQLHTRAQGQTWC
jgi:hypothetical protein